MEGVVTIMEQALQDLVSREDEVEASIATAQVRLADARAEKKQLERAIKEQRVAIERVKSGRGQKSGGRPTTTHPPAVGTRTRVVLDAIKTHGSDITLGDLTSRTGMPSGVVRPILGDLSKRGYVMRVEAGVYRALESGS